MLKLKSTHKMVCFPLRRSHESGIILIVVLWILVILSILALGLSRRTSIELALTKYALSQARSRYIAYAGIQYAIRQILLAGEVHDKNMSNTKYQCGFVLDDNQSPQEIFKDINVSSGYFSVGYSPLDEPQSFRYGFEDEEGRLDINALSMSDYKILKNLLVQFGPEDEAAEQIASSIIDWKDEDSEMFNAQFGAEEDYYMAGERPYHCKNSPFDSLEELMLVRGLTPEIFRRIQPYITIFPSQGRLLVDLDTASKPVLLALARNFAGPKTNTEIQDADSLVEKILVYRRGQDDLEATQDDRPLNIEELSLNAKEKVIAFQVSTLQTKDPRFFRVRSHGVDELWGASTEIEAIIDQEQGDIVSWRRL